MSGTNKDRRREVRQGRFRSRPGERTLLPRGVIRLSRSQARASRYRGQQRSPAGRMPLPGAGVAVPEAERPWRWVPGAWLCPDHEAQDLHLAQWRLLRAAVAPGPDGLFVAASQHSAPPASAAAGPTAWARQRYWHALPDGREGRAYQEFLAPRRPLLAWSYATCPACCVTRPMRPDTRRPPNPGSWLPHEPGMASASAISSAPDC
jgi:hypothetical protein